MAQTIQVHVDWVPPKSICDMMSISYRGLGNTSRGKVLEMLGSLRIRQDPQRVFGT
ncbi:hypothetical protein AAG906_029290 [Vitis piasezkii]